MSFTAAFVFGEDHTFDVFGEINLYYNFHCCNKDVRTDNVTLCNPVFKEDHVSKISFHEDAGIPATEELNNPIKGVFPKAEK